MLRLWIERFKLRRQGWIQFRTVKDKGWISLCCFGVSSDKVKIGRYTLIRAKAARERSK